MVQSVSPLDVQHRLIKIEHKFKLEDFGIRYIESFLKPFDPIQGKEIRAA